MGRRDRGQRLGDAELVARGPERDPHVCELPEKAGPRAGGVDDDRCLDDPARGLHAADHVAVEHEARDLGVREGGAAEGDQGLHERARELAGLLEIDVAVHVADRDRGVGVEPRRDAPGLGGRHLVDVDAELLAPRDLVTELDGVGLGARDLDAPIDDDVERLAGQLLESEHRVDATDRQLGEHVVDLDLLRQAGGAGRCLRDEVEAVDEHDIEPLLGEPERAARPERPGSDHYRICVHPVPPHPTYAMTSISTRIPGTWRSPLPTVVRTGRGSGMRLA